jgi:hypothetical protein
MGAKRKIGIALLGAVALAEEAVDWFKRLFGGRS